MAQSWLLAEVEAREGWDLPRQAQRERFGRLRGRRGGTRGRWAAGPGAGHVLEPSSGRASPWGPASPWLPPLPSPTLSSVAETTDRGPAGSAANVSCSPSPPSQAMGRACNQPRLPAPHPSPPCCPSSRWLPGKALGCPDTVPRGSGLPHSPDLGVAGSSDRAGQASPRLAGEPTWAGQGQAGVSA